MSIGWIKMRVSLAEDPAVIAMASTLGVDVLSVVGMLFAFWAWADAHLTDGRAKGVTTKWIDEKVRYDGFAGALIAAGWLVATESGIEIPKYERHNGTSAKKRAENTQRQRSSREKRDIVVTDATAKRDQRREEKKLFTAPSDGDWELARQKAKELSSVLGRCIKECDRRLLLGASYLAQGKEFNPAWLDIGLRETKSANANRPYAFFQKVIENQAESDGFNFRSSLSRLEIPQSLLARPAQNKSEIPP
jgi:hypothetical protein